MYKKGSFEKLGSYILVVCWDTLYIPDVMCPQESCLYSLKLFEKMTCVFVFTEDM